MKKAFLLLYTLVTFLSARARRRIYWGDQNLDKIAPRLR
jgi:hypothetical protein